MVYCRYSLESPHRVDFNAYTQYIFKVKKRKKILTIPKYLSLGYVNNFLGTQEGVRNNHNKRDINVRATEVWLYLLPLLMPFSWNEKFVYC